MTADIKEIFAEHKWLWLAVGVLIFAAGALAAVWLNARNAVDVQVPIEEIAATEADSRKINETIAEAQKQRDRLPEVVKNAKEKAAQSVGAYTDDDIARRWNGLLGRYREHKSAAGGI